MSSGVVGRRMEGTASFGLGGRRESWSADSAHLVFRRLRPEQATTREAPRCFDVAPPPSATPNIRCLKCVGVCEREAQRGGHHLGGAAEDSETRRGGGVGEAAEKAGERRRSRRGGVVPLAGLALREVAAVHRLEPR